MRWLLIGIVWLYFLVLLVGPILYMASQSFSEGLTAFWTEISRPEAYAVRLPASAPRLRAEPGSSRPPEWATPEEFALLAGRQFWWPLAAYVLRESTGAIR
ncbi:MAG: hypothetical protein V9F04_15175 [Dermatophilaceae bacterium]